MKQKKWMLIILCTGILAGCGASNSTPQSATASDPTSVTSAGVSSKVSSKSVQASQSEVNTVNSLQQSLSKGENDLQLNQ